MELTNIIEYKYDVLGRRIKRINNNLTYTKYYYGDQNLIQEEYYTKADKLKNQKNYVYSNKTDDVLTMENIDYKTRKIQEEYVNNKGVTKIRTIREEYTQNKHLLLGKRGKRINNKDNRQRLNNNRTIPIRCLRYTIHKNTKLGTSNDLKPKTKPNLKY